MPPYREIQLRERADPPTIKILDLWRSLSTQVLGRPLEVMVENRRKYPEPLSFAEGEVNFARPAGFKGQVVLSVWLDSFPDYSPLILTHEIGHWILTFRGFRGLLRQLREPNVEGCLNDVAEHSPLYVLQRSVGHDPTLEIDSRCDHDMRLCSQPGKEDPLVSALYLSDDLLNCSWKKRQELEWTIKRYRPQTMAIVTRIVTIAGQFDLIESQANLAFRKKLVKKLKMPGTWIEKDDVQTTRALILEIEKKPP